MLKGQVDQEGNYYLVKWDDREWQITYLTYSLEQSPSYKANRFLTTQ